MRSLFRRIGRACRVAVREWPLALAVLGAASLLLLPRAAASGAFRERRALDELSRLAPGDAGEFDRRLLDFLRTASASSAAEARRLAVDAALLRIRRGDGAALEEAARAREHLAALERPGRGPELARLLLNRGYFPEAAAVAREAGAAAELALALAEDALLPEARARAEEFAARLPAGRRAEGILLRVEVEARAGRTEDALAALGGAFPLERARLLARLDRPDEALAAVRPEAEAGSEAARLAELGISIRFGRTLRREPDRSSPAARVLLAAGAGDPDRLAAALGSLRGPEPLEDARLDLSWIAARLRSAAAESGEPARHARAFAALGRLYPGVASHFLDQAAAWRRAAELSPPSGARAGYRSAAEAFALASSRLDGASLVRAVRDAARSFDAAGEHARAAAFHRRAFELDPRGNPDGLFLQAESLARGGIWRPGAVEAYGAYLDAVAPGDPLLPSALLSRGRLLEALGEHRAALADYDRVLRDDLGIGPRTPEWEEALLARGRVRLELLQEGGRRDLEEYLERYAGETPPRAGAVEAAVLLGRAAALAGDPEAGLGALARALTLPAPDERRRAFRREAAHLRADLLLAAGRHAEAERAYEDALRDATDGSDRIGSLLGRARALARLGRTGEAREEQRQASALAGRTPSAAWRGELEAVARELR